MSLLDEERFPVRAKKKLGLDRHWLTLKNWHHKGRVCRKTGERVYLEAMYEGLYLVTSREAIRRFFCALNGIPIEQANGHGG